MQHMPLILEDSKGKEIEKANINFAPILDFVWSLSNKEEFRSILELAPYDDTLLNLNQVLYLIKDIKRLQNQIQDEEILKLTTDVVKFLGKVENFNYVRFIGD